MTPASGETAVPVPKEAVSDDSYRVTALLAAPGSRVAPGDPLAELESSKAAFTVASPAAGYFYPCFAEGETAGVGENLAVIAASPRQTAAISPSEGGTPDDRPDPRFSHAAWALFRESGLPAEVFDGFGHVRRSDVEAAVTARPPAAAAAPSAFPAPPESGGEEVFLLGGGGHARELIDSIEMAGHYRIAGILDTRNAPGTTIEGYLVTGDNGALPALLAAGRDRLVLAYGISGSHPARGKHFRELAALGFRFPPIVHPRANVSPRAVIGEGVQIMAGALAGSRARIGDACIINSNAVVSHDCVLGNNVHAAPGALIAGGAEIGDDTVVGMGASVYMRVRIGAGAVIYNGAKVFADVPDGAAVRGEWHGTRGG